MMGTGLHFTARKELRTPSQRSPTVATLIFFLSSGALAWQFALYPLTLKLLTLLRPRSRVCRRPITPSLTVIVPTHNEAAVIERRLRNLWESDYPKERMEIIVVDSGSSDRTAQIVKGIAGESPGHVVRLIQEKERRGKAAAINIGLAVASHDLVILSDAPTVFAKNTVRRIVSNMADARVGAATGTFRPGSRRNQAQDYERIFWSFKDLLRSLEGSVDSTTYLQGELCCFRKVLIDEVDEDTLADDVNIALKVRAAGYRVVADREALFIEEKPDTLQELAMRKSNAALGGIRESFRFRSMLFNRRFGLFGSIIFPTRILFSPLCPVLLMTVLLSGTSMGLRRLKLPPSMLALIAISGVATAVSHPGRLLARPIGAFLFSQWVIVKALATWLSGKYDVRWEQAKSVRTAVEPGPSSD